MAAVTQWRRSRYAGLLNILGLAELHYETHLDRLLYRAMAELDRLQMRRKARRGLQKCEFI